MLDIILPGREGRFCCLLHYYPKFCDKVFLFVVLRFLELLLSNCNWLVHYPECPNVSTTN